MWEIITGEFFWGIILGLLLSLGGSWFLAKRSFELQRRHQESVIRTFCIDTLENIAEIVREMDRNRDRSNAIHHDFLALIEVEVGIYGRNREHLIHLRAEERKGVRSFLNDVAIRRAQIVQSLDKFYRENSFADQIQAGGRPPEASRIREAANQHLQSAQSFADKLVALMVDGDKVVSLLKSN